MPVTVPPPPARLYRSADLFDCWTADDPHSWADCLDGATYRAAHAAGLRAPETDEVAAARARHDTAVTRLLHRRLVLPGRRVTAIMGGHSAERGSATYRAAARIAAALSRRGLTVLTGGGPGAMEAAHLGARIADTREAVDDAVDAIAADPTTRGFPLGPHDLVRDGRYDDGALEALHRWQAPAFALAARTADDANETIGVPTWLYGHEPPTPLATSHAKYFENSIREDGLLALAVHGIVFLPGSAGTLQEVFQDAAQNHYRTVRGVFSPMVFLDIDGHWSERFPIRPVLDALFSPEDRARVTWTANLDEAVEAIDQFRVPPEPDRGEPAP